ncbi:MAG: hypothetical protein ACKO3N_16900, partial [Verrucomicrobiota bacterium]
MLGNRLVAPRLDMRRFESGTAAIELSGGDVDSLGRAETPCLMNAAVLRGNELRGGKLLLSVGSQLPYRAEDILIEDNRIIDAPEGLDIGPRTAGVMLRRNQLQAVRRPLVGAGIETAWIEPGRRAEYWFESLAGIVGRLSSRPVAGLASLRAEATRLGDGADAEPRWLAWQRAVAPAVTRALPPPHHPDLAEALFGIRLAVSAAGPLTGVLETGAGGAAEFHVGVDHRGPDPVVLRLLPEWSSGWQGEALVATVPPRTNTLLRLPVRVPAGARGTFAFPARVQAAVGESLVEWRETLPAGQGRVRDWLVAGPELPGGSADPALFTRRPDQWRWDEPVRLGPAELPWRRMAGTGSLDLGGQFSAPPGASPGTLGALAVAVVEAETALWVEWIAALEGSGGRPELQFHLDGKELFDLRMGRETWSPKRLPFYLGPGRHVMLVTARGRGRLPGVSLEVRELTEQGGGRV